jgi:hypothetical protein
LQGLRDQVFTAIDEIRQGQTELRQGQSEIRQAQLRQDQVFRMMLTSLGLPIPDFFAEPQQQQSDIQPPPGPED